ncbi:MAG TPA: 16S rRNA (adenine(1518)-N(6)/adenine(1519)-N(6))-dimethyltransferase RsmA [Patescibacteria group bacterium]|jgi:16S rRNA (adenine1518-N6/adenine1519-N6)-dimethyltransferase|nr:16S rRNA (adenine(1518)-N(6)/adenine(1519)-N(6))-dimethyltransferase RsmA [Patescibacteria group bacterium]
MPTNKALGQHWLQDRDILARIADVGQITKDDTVLEIGPGLGTLTSELLRRAKRVVAVEFDEALAAKLPGQFPGTALEVVHQDILSYDLSQLPTGYIVVANVPYYITSKIIDRLMTADNKPVRSVLLVQKEVAERIAAGPGNMSLLALSAQLYTRARLDCEVPREYFTPPPKVDSQVVVLEALDEPAIPMSDHKALWRLAHAGFANKRKKLRSSLSAGLGRPVADIEQALVAAGIDPNLRAQALSIDDWHRLVGILDV